MSLSVPLLDQTGKPTIKIQALSRKGVSEAEISLGVTGSQLRQPPVGKIRLNVHYLTTLQDILGLLHLGRRCEI
jgi:hypothetical protein